MSSTLYHNTFAPWVVDGGRRIVASEREWAACQARNDNARWLDFRPRVHVECDVFEDWRGRMQIAKGNDLWVRKHNPFGWEVDDVGCQDWAYYNRPVTMQDVRNRLFDLIAKTPNLDWVITTKHPENVTAMVNDWDHSGLLWTMPSNVWFGTSVEDQKTAGERIPHLLSVPAAVRFLSMEPLLGPVDLERVQWPGKHRVDVLRRGAWDAPGCFPGFTNHSDMSGIDWVIVGGESGPGARPCNVEWIRDIVHQCKAAGVPVFVKQLGAKPVWNHIVPGCSVRELLEPLSLKNPKGGDMSEWPEDLRVQELPKVEAK